MKKNLKTACAKVTAVALALAMVASATPADAAKAKKPALSKSKVTINVGKTKKITVKKATPKKTTWTVNKKGKKVVKLTKKTKKGVTIKALKKGSATVTAKIKVGKKTYKKTVKVTVKKASAVKSATPATKAPSSQTPATKAPSNQTPATKVPGSQATATPTVEPTQEPVATPLVPEGNEFKVVPQESNMWDAVGTNYYSDLEFVDDGIVYTSTNAYNSCAAFYLANGLTVDVSDFDTLDIDLVCAYDDANPEDSVAKEAALKVWNTAATNFWGKTDGAYEGDPTTKDEPQGAARVWSMPLSTLVNNGINLSDIKAIGAVVNNAEGSQVKVKSFTFKKNIEDFVSKDTPKKVTIKQADSATKVEEGSSLELVSTVTNKNAAVIDKKVNWSSSDDTKATVDENGKVTGVKAGKVTITATVEGYEDVKATYEVEVFNNDPAAIAIQVENNYKTYTVEELLAANEGMEVKGVVLNANGDVVGNTTSQNITVKDAGTTGATISEGVLTATAAGTMTLELEATNEFEAVTLKVDVVDGYRVAMTADNVYNACQDAKSLKIENGVATITEIGNYNNGIGFKVTLPEGVTVADISGVSLYASTTQSGVTQVAPFAAYSDWSENITASANASWGKAQSFGVNTDIVSDGATVVNFDASKLETVSTSSDVINFSIGFINQNSGSMSASDVILLKKAE